MDGRSRPRKRDLIRQHVQGLAGARPFRPAAPSTRGPATVPPPPSASLSQTSLSAQPGQNFLEDALRNLTTEEDATIRRHLTPTREIGTAVQAAHDAAAAKKQECEAKRWRWEFRGRKGLMRDEAGKVLRWLDRFKAAGDVAANVDPLHVGLPWAGIRVMLEMTVAESRQMAALLTGMDLALCTTHRLQVYFNYFTRLPSTPATQNFESALIKTYTHVLRFLATAIDTYQKNTIRRTWQALWQTPTLIDFETESDKLGSRLEIEANNCDRELDAQKWSDAKQWKEDLEAELNEIRSVKTSLDRLYVKADLAVLTAAAATGAAYNSFAEQHSARCLEGTRTLLLEQVAHWADDPKGKFIFWLCGMAGTGKSTIARTIAHSLDKQGRVGASFFFKRGEGDRGNARHFFPTIATQLVDMVSGLDYFISQALDANSLLCERNLQEQFEKLLVQPLRSVTRDITPAGAIVVIDALDECEDREDIRMILKLLARIEDRAFLRLCVFVTSRPELPIQLGFQDMNQELYKDVVLEQVQATTIEHDIRAYVKHRFKEIKREDALRHRYDPLPVDWPGNDNIEALVRLAVPLFISAFTACRYIAESNPQSRLDIILQQGTLSGLDKTYLPILKQLILGRDDQEQAIHEFQELVGSIVLLADPLSAQSLSSLLEIPLRDIDERLSHLHSVLNMSDDASAPIHLLHLSFRDFLRDERNKHIFWVNKVQVHKRLAEKCLRRLSRPRALQKNPCRLTKPGTRRAKINKRLVEDSIKADVAYACRYWVSHMAEIKETIRDDDVVHQFLQSRFLHWLEALSWLGRLSMAITDISTLQSLVVEGEQGRRLREFLEYARRFVLRNRHIVDLAPLQLYLSALLFTPSKSIVKQTFDKHTAKFLNPLPPVRSNWSAGIQSLEGHSQRVNTVAFAPHGQTVASGSDDGTVRLWEARTGEPTRTLEGHSNGVTAVAFSPDGRTVASASFDETARLWDVTTGEVTRTLKGHSNTVNAVAFSPDGRTIASASDDQTVMLWNARTGEPTRTLAGHSNGVRAVAFSPKGQTVISASADDTMRLWDASSGESLRTLKWYHVLVNALDFSPDAQTVALAFDNETVQLWDTTTGEVTRALKGHSNVVSAVAFSSDGGTLASASWDKTVRLWDVKTRKTTQTLEAHSGLVSAVAFSPDRRTVASASADMTVRLWDVRTGGLTQALEAHNDKVELAFSPDRVAAISPSDGEKMRPWDATTSGSSPVFDGHGDRVTVVEFSLDGRTVASASADGTVWLWDVTTCEATRVLEGHSNSVDIVAFSPDGRTVASASNDWTVMLWDAKTGEPTWTFKGHKVTAVAFSPDGQIVALASYWGMVWLWDTTTGDVTRTLKGHSNAVNAVAFSPDGRTIASASDDQTVMLWNARTGEPTRTLKGHSSKVTSLAFSPDGLAIASASWDDTVRLWSVTIGEVVHVFETDILIWKLAYARDGKSLETNQGELDVSNFSSSAPSRATCTLNLQRRYEWIACRDQDILWLPQEYREEVSSSYLNLLVMGQRSGAVLFFKFTSMVTSNEDWDSVDSLDRLLGQERWSN